MGFRAHYDMLSDAGTSLKPEPHSGLTVIGLFTVYFEFVSLCFSFFFIYINMDYFLNQYLFCIPRIILDQWDKKREKNLLSFEGQK